MSGVIILIFISTLTLYFNNDIGVYKSNIEKNARVAHRIEDHWKVAKDTTATMSVMIFYYNSHSDHTFSIYVNRPGLSFGYFFRGGGSAFEIEKSIAELYIDGYNEYAFVSMNKQQVSKVEIDNGNTLKNIEIDSEKPFAFIFPVNSGSVKFYDINGNVVQSIRHRL